MDWGGDVALSDEERRLLEQMEQALAAEDPKLASALRGSTARTLHRRRALLAGLGFALGLVALVAGIEVSPIVSILGFLIMLASSIAGIASWQLVGGDAVRSAQPRPRATSDTAFRDRPDEPWRGPKGDRP
jgi:ferric-dicitrate binding protein FerR (iron transport regulator)